MRYGFHASIVLSGASTRDRDAVADQQRFAVGHHQVGLEHVAREAAPDRRDGADGVGHDLAVAPEALGDPDRAVVGAAHVAHSPTTFRYSA